MHKTNTFQDTASTGRFVIDMGDGTTMNTDEFKPRDTGLRSVRELFAGTPSGGEITLRRVDGTVRLNIYGTSFAAINQTLYTLPAGFRPDYHSLFPAQSMHAAGPRVIVSSTSGNITIVAASDDTPVYFSMTWLTRDAWPSTLPGTAA